MGYVLVGILGVVFGVLVAWIAMGKLGEKNRNQVANMQKNIDVLNQWLILKTADMSLASVLEAREIHKVAVYGMGISGRHLIRELENTRVEVCCGLDMKVKGQYKNIPIHKPGKVEISADAIINTVLYDEANIVSNIKRYYSSEIINLSDLVFGAYTEKSQE